MNQEERGGLQTSGQRVIEGAPPIQEYSVEIEFAALLRVILRRKVWITAATLLGTLAAIGYAMTATQWYRAEAVLMPRDSGASGGLSGQLAQLGGLASMAGIALGQTSKQEPLGVLRSAGFARRFVKQNGLEAELFEEFFQAPVLGTSAPDQKLQRVVEKFRRSVFSVMEDKKNGLVTVAIEWKDPVVAARWANSIHRQLNEEMRQRALDESTRNVEYLQAQLDRTEMVSLQQAISRIIESELQKLMLAQGTDEFAFRVIDDAQPPSRRSRPKRAVLVVIGFLGGLSASILAAIMLDPLKALWREVTAG
jgi:uncharacterized protein involved in exopolysaccharide biosynthesis